MKTESVRQKRVAGILQNELGIIFQQDAKNLFGNLFITVTQVKITPDLRDARVYLSFFTQNAQEKEEYLFQVEERHAQVKRLLVRKIGKQLRAMPQLTFLLDEVDEEAEKMDKLLDSLDIPSEESGDNLEENYKKL